MKSWAWFNLGMMPGFLLLALNFVAPEPGLAFTLMLVFILASFVARSIADLEEKPKAE